MILSSSRHVTGSVGNLNNWYVCVYLVSPCWNKIGLRKHFVIRIFVDYKENKVCSVEKVWLCDFVRGKKRVKLEFKEIVSKLTAFTCCDFCPEEISNRGQHFRLIVVK